MHYIRKTNVGVIGITIHNGEAHVVSFGVSVPFGKFDDPDAVVEAYNMQIEKTEDNFKKYDCAAESVDDWEKPLTY